MLWIPFRLPLVCLTVIARFTWQSPSNMMHDALNKVCDAEAL